ncbi:hypothetical protein Hanom_Chr08g00755271 [Helianthus anomalus]
MYLRTLFFLSSLAPLSLFQTLIFIHSKPFSIVRSPINLKPYKIYLFTIAKHCLCNR